jgi:hypothetical protein
MNIMQDELNILDLTHHCAWIDHFKVKKFANYDFFKPTSLGLHFQSKDSQSALAVLVELYTS